MKVFADKQKVYSVLMRASVVFGVLYILISHMNYLMNMIEYRAIFLTNIVYAFFRLECLALPLVFCLRRNTLFQKILMEKVFLAAFAASALSGVMWVFKYLNYYTLRELFNRDMMYVWQATMTNYIAANRLMWGTTAFDGVILSFVLSIMYFVTALLMHHNRRIVAICFEVIFLFRLVAPIVCIGVGGDTEVYLEWFRNNILWLLSSLCMTAGIRIAAQNDEMWLDNIWGEEMELEFDDDEDN